MTGNLAARTAIAVLLASFPIQAQDRPAAHTIAEEDWTAYKEKFLDTSGRLIDDANGNVSHSEGQGYGLLLAYLAGNKADFELIWSFTRTELLLRDDHLAAWRWDPAASPHVTDTNNATDGDILIGYALALAGEAWQEPELVDSAQVMIRAISAAAVVDYQGRSIILPGAAGFSRDDRPDGPVVNLSYWVFEAFPVFAELDTATDWKKVSQDGLAILKEAGSGPRNLPPDWLSLRTRPKPAQGFAPDFGYNALRIPLYLTRAGLDDASILRPLVGDMNADSGIAIVDLPSGKPKQMANDPGYRIIAALASCVLEGKPIPAELRSFEPTAYYPSTLHLLALAHIAENREDCP